MMLRTGNKQGLETGSDWERLARRAGFRATKLAELSGVSLRTLQRHFKTQYGLTVSEWLTETRLREAGHRIKAGQRVKEVALDLGYKQLSHFSREFKRAFGQPPSRMSTTERLPTTPLRNGTPSHTGAFTY